MVESRGKVFSSGLEEIVDDCSNKHGSTPAAAGRTLVEVGIKAEDLTALESF